MDYLTYKLLHVIGVLLVFVALGGAAFASAAGAAGPATRRLAGILHGVGLLVLLVSGFGTLARLEIHWPWPGWVIGKAVLWLLLGAALPLSRRLPGRPALWSLVFVALGGVAAWLALLKPIA